MATVKVKLRQSVVKGKTGSVYYQITHKAKSVRISTLHKLLPEEWNERNQEIALSNTDNAFLSNIQRQLNDDIVIIQSIIKKKEEAQNEYSAVEIGQLFKERLGKCSLLTFIEEEISRLKGNNKLGTALNYLRTKNSLSNFLNGEDLMLCSCTETLVLEYDKWLKNRDLKRNTLSFYMRIFHSAYNKASLQEGLLPQNIFHKVYTGVDKTHKRAISEEFIIRLRNLEFPSDSPLNLSRDMFIFSFYTRGMSFVDMVFLRKIDIQKGVIQYVRRKTAKYMCIQIENCMMEIIRRYDTAASAYLFPIIKSTDEQTAYTQYQSALNTYNRHLKKLGEILDIPIPLSSYISRHTWATMARDHNIPLPVISAGMGHNSEKTTQIYLASLDESVIDQANRLIIAGVGGI